VESVIHNYIPSTINLVAVLCTELRPCCGQQPEHSFSGGSGPDGVELSIRWKSVIHNYIPSTINLEIFLDKFSKTM